MYMYTYIYIYTHIYIYIYITTLILLLSFFSTFPNKCPPTLCLKICSYMRKIALDLIETLKIPIYDTTHTQNTKSHLRNPTCLKHKEEENIYFRN